MAGPNRICCVAGVAVAAGTVGIEWVVTETDAGIGAVALGALAVGVAVKGTLAIWTVGVAAGVAAGAAAVFLEALRDRSSGASTLRRWP